MLRICVCGSCPYASAGLRRLLQTLLPALPADAIGFYLTTVATSACCDAWAPVPSGNRAFTAASFPQTNILLDMWRFCVRAGASPGNVARGFGSRMHLGKGCPCGPAGSHLRALSRAWPSRTDGSRRANCLLLRSTTRSRRWGPLRLAGTVSRRRCVGPSLRGGIAGGRTQMFSLSV